LIFLCCANYKRLKMAFMKLKSWQGSFYSVYRLCDLCWVNCIKFVNTNWSDDFILYNAVIGLMIWLLFFLSKPGNLLTTCFLYVKITNLHTACRVTFFKSYWIQSNKLKDRHNLIWTFLSLCGCELDPLTTLCSLLFSQWYWWGGSIK